MTARPAASFRGRGPLFSLGRFGALSLALGAVWSLSLPASAAPVAAAGQMGSGASKVEPSKPVATSRANALSLTEAVRLGLAQSPDLRAAEFEVAKADLAVTGAQAERFTYSSDLAVGNRVGAAGLLSTQPLQVGMQPTANGTVMLKVPLFTGFRLSEQIHGAEAGALAARARATQSRQQLTYAIMEAYYQARRAELRLGILREARAQAAQSRDVVAANFKVGRASANELDRAEVSLYNQESDVLKAEGDRDVSREQLASLLARDLTGVELADPTPVVPASSREAQTLDGFLAQAKDARPDLVLARAQVAASAAAVEVAKADRWPQLDLVSAYQHGNNPFIATSQNRSVLDAFTGVWDARFNVSYHLFDHGVVGRNIEKSELELAGAREALVLAERRADLEVRQAFRRREQALARIALGAQSEALAVRNLRWLEGRFKYGYALAVELNEARVNLVDARTQRVDAQIDYQLANAALERAMGRLELPPAEREAGLPGSR